MITQNDSLITSSYYTTYRTKAIKRSFDTKITEFSIDGAYDYMPGPEVTIQTPNSPNLKFWIEDKMRITWYSEEYSLLPKVDIFYKIESGSLVKIFGGVDNSITSSIEWTIDTGNIIGKNFTILVSGYFEGEVVEDYSDYMFEIDKRYINILPFNDNKILANASKVFPVKWESNGTSKNVKIELYNYVTGEFISVLNNKYFIESENTYNWSVNNISVGTDMVKVKITDLEFPWVWSMSDPIDVIVPFIKIRDFAGNTFNPLIRIRQFSSLMFNPVISIKNFQIM